MIMGEVMFRNEWGRDEVEFDGMIYRFVVFM